MANLGLRVRYLHSEVETIERVELLRDLRLGTYDILVGINLLREGLDLPEVSLIAILDADKHSDAMKEAIQETNRRRAVQQEYNEKHGITPTTIIKSIQDLITREKIDKQEIQKGDITVLKSKYNLLQSGDRKKYIKDLEREMLEHAKNLEFEQAAILRDEIDAVKNMRFSG